MFGFCEFYSYISDIFIFAAGCESIRSPGAGVCSDKDHQEQEALPQPSPDRGPVTRTHEQA